MSRASALASRLLLRTRQEGARRAVPEVKTGERPYADIPAAQVAAYRAAAARERLAPRLTFTTAPAAETRPIPVVPGAAGWPDIAPVCAQAATTDPADLARAVPAIQEIDFDAVDEARETEGATYAGVVAARSAELSPAPDLSQAERFTADMRFRGGLPLFRKTAAAVGWRGLNEDPPLTGWVQYTVARWDQQARVAIAAATEAALAEVHADFDAARQRVMAPGASAAGAR